MQNQYINLHNHTTYSLLDGAGRIDAYVKRAKQLGQPALSITDHGNLLGWMDFYDSALKHELKPILGIETYQARIDRFNKSEIEATGKETEELKQRGPYHLTVLARNKTGYHNLMKLSSRAYMEGWYKYPRVDHELIAEHADGLIVLSGCLSGEVCQAILRGDEQFALEAAAKMQDIVGKENYFIEVMNHEIDDELKVLPKLVEVAKKIGAKIVPTQDSHYVGLEDSDIHDLFICISTASNVADENRFKFKAEEFYLKSYDEMLKRFPAEWLANTVHVADLIDDYNLEFNKPHFPNFTVPKEHTLDTFFLEKVWDGVKKYYGDPIPEDVISRVEYELNVIRTMGFQSYFLVVADIVDFARSKSIRTGGGRGSASASVVSYVLGITKIDPLRFGLLFDRFLTIGRENSLPDIDIDVDDRRRDEVIQYARDKYGEDNVAHIVTFQTIQSRSAIRDVVPDDSFWRQA